MRGALLLTVVLSLARAVVGGSLASDFAEAAKGAERVWTLGVVGPKLESEVLLGTFGDRATKKGGCVLRDDVVLVECREAEVDLSDATRLSANAVGAMACADGLVYVAQESEARQSSRFLSGLVAGLEASLRTGRRKTKMVVIAIAGPTVDRGLVQEVDRLAREDAWAAVSKPRGFTDASPPKVVVVRAQDVDAVFGSSVSRSLRDVADEDDARRSVDVADLLAAAKGTGFPPHSGPPKKATKTFIHGRRAVEMATGAKLAEAAEALLRDGGFADAAKDTLARRFDDKFCETYADECDLIAGDALDRFDDAVSAVAEQLGTSVDDVEQTDAYARKRADVRETVLGKLDDEFLDAQLQLLFRQTAKHLRTGLKNLRISKSMTKQTQSLLQDADDYFVSKATTAFGPGRPWKAKQKDAHHAMADYITERLQMARLQGTYLPENDGPTSPLARIWPFPTNFACHWLIPTVLNVREQQARGLTDSDIKAFGMVTPQGEKPPLKFAVTDQISSFAKKLTKPPPVEIEDDDEVDEDTPWWAQKPKGPPPGRTFYN